MTASTSSEVGLKRKIREEVDTSGFHSDDVQDLTNSMARYLIGSRSDSTVHKYVSKFNGGSVLLYC